MKLLKWSFFFGTYTSVYKSGILYQIEMRTVNQMMRWNLVQMWLRFCAEVKYNLAGILYYAVIR